MGLADKLQSRKSPALTWSTPDWTESLSPLSIYYALFCGHLLLWRNNKAFGGKDFYLGLTREIASKAPEGEGNPPALTLAEALSLMKGPPGDASKYLYEILQLNIGTLMEGEWGEEPINPLLTDPRPDLKEDSQLWERLLALALAEDKALAEALFAIRWGGSRLVEIKGHYAIRPQVGPGGWLQKKDYEEVRDIWLAPYKEQVAGLLRRLKAASSKAS